MSKRAVREANAGGNDTSIGSHGRRSDYLYSFNDCHVLSVDIRQKTLLATYAEGVDVMVNPGEEYASTRENTAGIFISDPYYFDQGQDFFSDYLNSDIDRITKLGEFVGIATRAWARLPEKLIIPLLSSGGHWRVICAEIDYGNREDGELWSRQPGVIITINDPYGGTNVNTLLRDNVEETIGSAVNKLLLARYEDVEGIALTSSFKIKEMDQQGRGVNGYDCGPITFSNIRDYAREAISGNGLSEFVDFEIPAVIGRPADFMHTIRQTDSTLYAEIAAPVAAIYPQRNQAVNEFFRKTTEEQAKKYKESESSLDREISFLSPEKISYFFTLLDSIVQLRSQDTEDGSYIPTDDDKRGMLKKLKLFFSAEEKIVSEEDDVVERSDVDISFFKFEKTDKPKKSGYKTYQKSRSKTDDTSKDEGKVEEPGVLDEHELVAIKALDYLEAGYKAIDGIKVEEKAVIFLGVTGGGKSTLLTYLSDDGELRAFKKPNGQWALKATKELPGIKIGHDPESTTFYPKSYTSDGTDFTYIDLPGFDNVESTTIESSARDIAAAYFRAKIGEMCSSIKVVIVIPHTDFTRVDGRGQALGTAITSLAEFLQPIGDGILPYISMVVTQVDQEAHLVRVRSVARNRELLERYQKEVKTLEEIEELERDIEDLQQKIDKRDAELKQGIMVSLEEFQALRELPRTQLEVLGQIKKDFTLFSKYYNTTLVIPTDEKLKILESIQSTHYVNKSEFKVKIVVSKESQIAISNLSEKSVKNSAKLAREISEEIEKFCDDVEEQHDDFSAIIDELTSIKENLQYISRSTSGKDFLKYAECLYTKIPGVKEKLKNLDKWVSYLDFCHDVNPEVSFDKDQLFITALSDLDDRIEECQITLDLEKFSLALEKMCKEKMESGEDYDEIVSYLQSIATTKLSKSDSLAEFIKKIGDLERELDIKLDHVLAGVSGRGLAILREVEDRIGSLLEPTKAKFSDSNFELKVTGYFVTATEISSNIAIFADRGQSPSVVKVFAMHTIFLDTDLVYPRLSVVMIAPRWKITVNGDIEERIIDLHGKNGEVILPTKAADGAPVAGQELDGSGKVGNHGMDGLPGNPGGNGGDFFGVCKKFYNISDCKFTINVSGGNGGRGQDGGDGSNGSYGQNCLLEQISISSQPKEDVTPIYIKEIKRSDLGAVSQVVHLAKCAATYNSKYLSGYLVKGGIGGEAGNGGRGGEGGIPGFPGNITVLPDFLDHADFVQGRGSYGHPGDTGSVGKSGVSGTGYYGEYWSEEIFANIRRALSGKKTLPLNPEIEYVVSLGVAGEIITQDYFVRKQEEERIQERAVRLMQEITKGSAAVAVQVTKETVKEFSKETVKVATQTVTKEATKEAGKALAKDVFQQTLGLGYGEALKEMTKKLVTEFGEEAAKGMIHDVAKTYAKETAMAISKGVSKDTIKFMTSEVTRDLTNHLAKGISSELVKDSVVEAGKSTFFSSVKAGFTVANFAKGVGISAVLSVVSAYTSSDWILGPVEVEGTLVDDRAVLKAKNKKGIKYPSETASSMSIEELLEEYSEYLETCSLIGEDSLFTEDFTI